MPQGRRKQPFSGKAKKQQLQEKKSRKGKNLSVLAMKSKSESDTTTETTDESHELLKINAPSTSTQSTSKSHKSGRYALHCFRETDEEVRSRKESARKTIVPMEDSALEICIQDFFVPELDFPKRPEWNYSMSRQQLELREQKYFSEYVSRLCEKFQHEIISFELNLEIWRQFWRVLEMSDIILVIVDIRFPALMFPPSLYDFITGALKKDVVLVLNKIDLAPPSLVAAWEHYFKGCYPELHIVMFTSFPAYNLRGNLETKSGLKVCRRKGKLRMAAEGAQKLFDVCKEIVNNRVDLSSWHNKIMEEMQDEYDFDGIEIQETHDVKKVDTTFVDREKFSDGVLTIGCIGQPNVGKSSMLNAVMGKKVVSVSRTPGHTKHFQTIFLTPQVKLCDCPGLVFPSKASRPLQVLMGSFPIAQLREPYSTVQYLAERLDLPRMLSLIHVEGDSQWSAFDICEAWAKKRGFFTARAARLDTYRAANHLLRMALDGKICLCLYPSGYASTKHFWENHEVTKIVQWIQASQEVSENQEEISSSGDEEEGQCEAAAMSSRIAPEWEEGTSSDNDYSNDTKYNSGNEDSDDEGSEDTAVISHVNKFSALDD